MTFRNSAWALFRARRFPVKLRSVIAEVDEALCRALARVLPKGTVVRLDPPKPTWQTEKPSQAIDLFLFNLAGDERGAASGFEEVRDAQRPGAVPAGSAAALPAVLPGDGSRAPKIAEEHELLDTALRALTEGESLPESCLPEALLETGMPVMVDLDPAGPGHLWTSLGMPARAAFVITVSAPHRPKPDTELAPPAEKIDLQTDHDVRLPVRRRGSRRAPRPRALSRSAGNGSVTASSR